MCTLFVDILVREHQDILQKHASHRKGGLPIFIATSHRVRIHQGRTVGGACTLRGSWGGQTEVFPAYKIGLRRRSIAGAGAGVT